MAELKLFGSLDPRIELDRLRLRELNFEPLDLPRLRNDPAWRVDHYGITLPPERPGDPVDGGSWSVARQLCALYEFVDPAIVRAYYHPDVPVEGRTMLLEIIFWGLRIYAGVRVGGEFDGLRAEDGRHARVWAWNYQTLRGHFERGRVDYEVWKWLDTGEVEFRLDTVSSAAEQGNFVVRLGFRLFGRRKADPVRPSGMPADGSADPDVAGGRRRPRTLHDGRRARRQTRPSERSSIRVARVRSSS